MRGAPGELAVAIFIEHAIPAELSREGELGLQRPECWRIIKRTTEKCSVARAPFAL